MRSIALALTLAAAPFLSGCFSAPCDAPTVTIYWTLQDVNGVAASCAAVTTQYIDVYLESGGTTYGPYSFDCAPGVGTVPVPDLPPGGYTATVEGVDADGRTIWNRDQFPVTVGSCGDTSYGARPGEGTLSIDYHFAPVDGCGTPPTYMWFAVWDLIAGQSLSTIDENTLPTSWLTFYTCGPTVDVAVPFGHYALDKIQEVSGSVAAGFTKLYQACNEGPFTVNTPGTTLSSRVDLTAYAGACPAPIH